MAADTVKKDHVFNTAAEITDPAKREEYLDAVCGGDTQLRAEIEELLRHDVAAGNFLEEPIVGERPTEVLNALTDRDGVPVPTPSEVSLDFLKPCATPDRLGMLGPYEVIEMIGKGGMGVVLRAHDPKLNRVVAVKVLAPEFAANPTARKRFLREAQAAAAISHPHVVGIHAVDEAENSPYLVMEYIDGLSLQDKIERDGHLNVKEILRIGSQIAAGLAAAHSQGLIHRDVKPGNILLENGVERVKITDFGLARAVDDVSVTRTGDVAGTPLFMSPEQAQAEPLDHRSDLFSLGCVLYAMCTGRSPFRAETTVAVLRRVCDETPRPIHEVNPDIPDWLAAIIDQLLAKAPDQRFQSASEVSELLSSHLAHIQHPSAVLPPKPTRAVTQRTGRPLRRRGLLVTVTLLLLLFGVLSLTEATGVTELAATVIRIATGEGTLVIEVDDPTVKVSIDGEEVTITGAGVEELKLRPGRYKVQAIKDGKSVKQEIVTVTRGERQVLRVTLQSPMVTTHPLYFVQLGNQHIRKDELDKAVLCYNKASEFASLVPQDGGFYRSLAEAYAGLGNTFYDLGRAQQAAEAFGTSHDHAIKAIKLNPKNYMYKRWLANSLSACPISKIRNPGLALEWAEIASRQNPNTLSTHMCLGHAHYRAGNWKAAVENLEQWWAKTTLVRQDTQWYFGFVLAMAHYRLGHEDEARRWYDETIRKTAGVTPKYPTRARIFRAEATKLLGISEEVDEEIENTDQTTLEQSKGDQESGKAQPSEDEPSTCL